MKVLTAFSIAFIFLAFMFAGCGDDDDDDLVGPGGTGGVGGYGAFPPAAGSWAEHTDVASFERFRMESIGTDTLEGHQCALMEYEFTDQGQTTIMQIWMELATGQPVFMFMKQGGRVIRMNMVGFEEIVDMVKQAEPTGTTQVGTGKYRTHTGKTVDTVEYRLTEPASDGTTTVTDYSISAQVPFSQVETKENGTQVMALYDFAAMGAFRDITKQEAETAQSFSFPGGDIPGGDLPDTPGGQPDTPGQPADPGIPVDPGDPGVGGGGIVITVGLGARPLIQVSEPIYNLIILHGFNPVWGFESLIPFGQGPGLPGPFQYGVVPVGAKDLIGPNAPDLIAGQTYNIQVMGMQGFLPILGILDFVR